jgi:multiple sugar transport system permease protein
VTEQYAELKPLKVKSRQVSAFLFLAPALLFLGVFFLYPVLWTISISVAEYDPVTASARSAGMSHYRDVFTSPAVWRAILNTAYFSAVYIPLTLLSAGAIALLLGRRVRSAPLLRAIFCAPCVVPAVGAALIWRAAYAPSSGSIDRLLYMLGCEHGPGWAGWLAEPYLVMPCIALMCVWRDTGFFALILLSALARVPQETYELARTDGATRCQTFAHITIPMCLGTLGLCLVMLVINVQSVFQEIYVMTEDGGPANWSVNLAFLVYRRVYVDYSWGQAAALSVVLFAVTVVIILVQNRILNRRLGWTR